MIRTTGSEFAANRSGLSAPQEKCVCFARSTVHIPIRAIILPRARSVTSQTAPCTPIPDTHATVSVPTRDKSDHSKPIGRTVVERFSPTRFLGHVCSSYRRPPLRSRNDPRPPLGARLKFPHRHRFHRFPQALGCLATTEISRRNCEFGIKRTRKSPRPALV